MGGEELRRRRTIVLIGMMGAGKSSVGPLLAARLGLPFLDLDREVEQRAGKTVADIFGKEGEAAFRALEKQAAADTLAGEACVIALGGGAFEAAETRALALAQAQVVWLDAAPATVADRLGESDDRPLLVGGERLEKLVRLHARRAGNYALAHHRVATDNLTPDQVAARVAALVR